MKKIISTLITIILVFGAFLTGFLIRQPKINMLKKQIEQLQNEVGRLQMDNKKYHVEFQNALFHLQSLKAINFIKKRNAREKTVGILILQYSMKDYLSLLLERFKNGSKMEKNEIRFFNIYSKVLDGQNISDIDKEKVREYILNRYKGEIENLQEYDCSDIINLIKEYNCTSPLQVEQMKTAK